MHKENILVARQHTDPATLLHPGEILLGLAHVRVDLIHPLLDPIQLFCPHTPVIHYRTVLYIKYEFLLIKYKINHRFPEGIAATG